MISTDYNDNTGDGIIVLTPNNSATWRFNLLIVTSLGIILLCMSLYFVLQGLWLILPFSGLEVIALISALYYCVYNNITTEVIIFDGDTVIIERGHHHVEDRYEYNRAWSTIFVRQPKYRGHMKKIFIRSHGREQELGAFLNKADRELFIKSLKHVIYS